MDCIFCKIIGGTIKGDILHDDEHVVAFRDLTPQAPLHALVVPRDHIATMNDAGPEHEPVLGRLLSVGAKVAREAGYTDYRMNINTNRGAGQSVFHVHLHVLAGRTFGWPPG